jgi:hypothetical protein
VHERRQRATRPLFTGLLILSVLGLNSGCDVGASVGGAQTAVVVAQTAVNVAQTALPAMQTSLPGIQATAQAGATMVAAVLSDPQAINAQLQVVLAGAAVEVKPTPADAANDAVTHLDITGTDTRGTLAQMDANTRQGTAGAALLLVSQYYPTATISLALIDGKGGPLLSGTKAPGQGPAFQ